MRSRELDGFSRLWRGNAIKYSAKGNQIAQDSLGAFYGLWTRDGKAAEVRTGYLSLSRAGHNPGVETLHFLTWVMERETFP